MIKIIGIAILLLSVVSGLYYLEVRKNAKLELQVEQLNANIEKAESKRISHDKEITTILQENAESIRELNSFRGREDVILAKPGLVAIKINKSFKDSQLLLACETGDQSACSRE